MLKRYLWNPFALFLWYFITVGVFFLIYLGSWKLHPDSFIINSEVNEHPMRPYRIDGDVNDLYYRWRPNLTLSDIELLLREYEIKLVLLDSHIHYLNGNLEITRDLYNSVSDRHHKEMDKNIESHIAQEIAPLVRRRDSLQLTIDKMEQDAAAARDPDVTQTVIADMKVEQSNLALAIVRKELQLRKESLSDLSRFQDPDLVSQVRDLWEALTSVENILTSIESVFWMYRGELTNTWAGLAKARRERLSPLDIAYFSVVTATTTGYGDIVPNSRWTRCLAMSEIILCTIVFGCFLACITQPMRRHQTELSSRSYILAHRTRLAWHLRSRRKVRERGGL